MSTETDQPMSMKAKTIAWAAHYGPGANACRELYARGCPFDQGDDAVLAWIATRPTGLTKNMANKIRQEILKRTGPPPAPEPAEGADTSGNGSTYASTLEGQGRLVKFLEDRLAREMQSGMEISQDIFDMHFKAVQRLRELHVHEQKVLEAKQNMVPKKDAIDILQSIASIYDDNLDQMGWKMLDRMRGKNMDEMPEVFEELRLEVAARINNELSSWAQK